MNANQGQVSDRNGDIDIIAFLRMLWDRKLIIVVITGLFGFASVYHALTATHIYSAQTVITKVSENGLSSSASIASQLGGLANIAGISLAGGGTSAESQAILESRHLVEEFVRKNDLISELSPDGGKQLTLWLAVQKFRDANLSVRENIAEGTIAVTVNWTDPEKAASWANQFVALANEQIRSRAQEEAAKNIDYLNKQIELTSVVEIQSVLYNLIESETKSLMLANAREEYAFTVVDPAVAPEFRSSPRRTLIVLTGGGLGFVISILGILLWNFIGRLRRFEQYAE